MTVGSSIADWYQTEVAESRLKLHMTERYPNQSFVYTMIFSHTDEWFSMMFWANFMIFFSPDTYTLTIDIFMSTTLLQSEIIQIICCWHQFNCTFLNCMDRETQTHSTRYGIHSLRQTVLADIVLLMDTITKYVTRLDVTFWFRLEQQQYIDFSRGS